MKWMIMRFFLKGKQRKKINGFKKMNELNKENIEIVKYSYSLEKGDYIKHVFYEFETGMAVKFGRNEDEKILWVPKSVIKGGWNKDKQHSQEVCIRPPIPLKWKQR